MSKLEHCQQRVRLSNQRRHPRKELEKQQKDQNLSAVKFAKPKHQI
jgi:hypothetical protein